MKKIIITFINLIILFIPNVSYAKSTLYENIKNKFFLNNFRLNLSIFILMAVTIIFLIIQFRKYLSLKNENQSKTITDLYVKLSPSQAGMFIKGSFKPESFIVATILDWYRQNIISVDFENKLNRKNKKRTNYIFNKISSIGINSPNSEKYLFDSLFSMGSCKYFSTDDLLKNRKESSNEFNLVFNEYLNLVRKELTEKNLKYEKPPFFYFSIFSILVSLIVFSFSLISIKLNLFSMINLILSVLLLILALITLSKQPKLGAEQFKLYNELYKSLLNNSLNFENFSEEKREKIILLSVACSIDYKNIKKLAHNFNLDLNSFIPIFWSNEVNLNIFDSLELSLIGTSPDNKK